MNELSAAPMLEAIETFFSSETRDYRSWTLPQSKRKLRILSVGNQPWQGHATHIAFDAFRVQWPGVRPNARIIPIVPVLSSTDPHGEDGSFHAALLLDWAIAKNVAPAPEDVVLSLGHGPALPHVRFEYAFPWEQDGPAEICVAGHLLLPLIAYSVSDAEARFQHEHGSKALTDHLSSNSVPLFDRSRPTSL